MIKTKFKELADARGLSINKISKETGITRPTPTTMYKENPTGIQFDTLSKLTHFFGVTISDFLYDDLDAISFTLRLNPNSKYGFQWQDEDGNTQTRKWANTNLYKCVISGKGRPDLNFDMIVTLLMTNGDSGQIVGIRAGAFANKKSHNDDVETAVSLMAGFDGGHTINLISGFWRDFDQVPSTFDETIIVAIEANIGSSEKPRIVQRFPLHAIKRAGLPETIFQELTKNKITDKVKVTLNKALVISFSDNL